MSAKVHRKDVDKESQGAFAEPLLAKQVIQYIHSRSTNIAVHL